MRCAYLAQDRADISEAIKCLARGMSKPRTGHMMQLKRVAKVLKKECQGRHISTPHTNRAKHIWKSMWTAIGQETYCAASKLDWSDRETWTTFAQT